MINYEDANRALDKAKPGKKSTVISHSSSVIRVHCITSSMRPVVTALSVVFVCVHACVRACVRAHLTPVRACVRILHSDEPP